MSETSERQPLYFYKRGDLRKTVGRWLQDADGWYFETKTTDGNGEVIHYSRSESQPHQDTGSAK